MQDNFVSIHIILPHRRFTSGTLLPGQTSEVRVRAIPPPGDDDEKALLARELEGLELARAWRRVPEADQLDRKSVV